jgi:hypothetical protein
MADTEKMVTINVVMVITMTESEFLDWGVKEDITNKSLIRQDIRRYALGWVAGATKMDECGATVALRPRTGE